MKFIFFLPLALVNLGAPCQINDHCIESHKINYQFNENDQILPNHLQLTKDSVLVFQYWTLVEFSFFGDEIRTFSFDNDGLKVEKKQYEAEIANFTYLPDLDLIAIVLWLGEDKNGKAIYQTRFYDRSDQSYFVVYDPKQETPRFSYFNQFISTSDHRLFINTWTKKNLTEDRFLLQEVALMPNGNAYNVTPIAEPFHLQRREFEKDSNKFKRRWIVSRNNELLVINQTQSILKHYAHLNNDKRNNLYEKEDYFTLDKWVIPYQKRQDMSPIEWLYSFSQNVGLYEIGSKGELLWGYLTPYSGGPDDDDDEKVPSHMLKLQVLDKNGKASALKEVEGGQLIGVQAESERAFVLLPPGEEDQFYSICQIQF